MGGGDVAVVGNWTWWLCWLVLTGGLIQPRVIWEETFREKLSRSASLEGLCVCVGGGEYCHVN